MLQKCLNWWRWSMDSPGLTLFNPGSSTTYWWCTWTGCIQFHQDSMEKDTIFTQEFSREKRVSCLLQEKKLMLRHQKFMKTWISAANRSHCEQRICPLHADMNWPMVNGAVFVYVWHRRDVKAGCLSPLLMIFATYADGWWQCTYCTSIQTDCSCRKAI